MNEYQDRVIILVDLTCVMPLLVFKPTSRLLKYMCPS